MTEKPKGERPRHTATVRRTEWIAPSMVRVVFEANLDAPELFADSYVKLLFDGVQRAYTVRRLDRGELWIDFVVHGDAGLAGPWAAAAVAGDTLEFVGPGGDWSPRPAAELHLFVGDESALPAIASGIERLLADDPKAKALVFGEVAAPEEHYPLPEGPGVEVHWVYRNGGAYGAELVDAVLENPYPVLDVEAFVHGNADMVRPLRRYLLGERGLAREHLSISGYWRAGHTDEEWRDMKRSFNAAMESDVV